MASDAYQFPRPPVRLTMYWVEVALLVASILTPIIAWLAWRDGVVLARSGSVMVFFAAVAEFFTLNKANRKHLLNAARVKAGEMPWDFSRAATLVGLASLVCAAVGTLLWGFGDVIVA
jgi:hypothetical protein